MTRVGIHRMLWGRLVATAILAGTWGCRSSVTPPGTVAVVGGEAITRERFAELAGDLLPFDDLATARRLTRTLIAGSIACDGRSDCDITTALDARIASRNAIEVVADGEVARAYEASRPLCSRPRSADLVVIAIDADAPDHELLVERAMSHARSAKTASAVAAALRGLGLEGLSAGWHTLVPCDGSPVPGIPFEVAARGCELRKGQVAELTTGDGTAYIVRCGATYKARDVPLAAAAAEITAGLRIQKRAEARERVVDELLIDHAVSIDDVALARFVVMESPVTGPPQSPGSVGRERAGA